ncbi:MAG: hypothetical protein FWD08_08505 [Alphaproteobacteria bacterium]|nr:hypothetical protein [Alphaproteobacteria bacterium]
MSDRGSKPYQNVSRETFLSDLRRKSDKVTQSPFKPLLSGSSSNHQLSWWLILGETAGDRYYMKPQGSQEERSEGDMKAAFKLDRRLLFLGFQSPGVTSLGDKHLCHRP